MILHRYLRNEVLVTTAAVTGVLLFIFLCNQFVLYLGYVAQGKFASWMLFRLVLLQIPILLGLLMPLGLFLGILLAYGRLYAESEMTVLFASGYSRQQLVRFTLRLSAWAAVLIAVLSLWISPVLAKKRDLLLAQAEASSIVQKIMPGQFQAAMNGKQVYYVESLSRDRKKMNAVFFAQQLAVPPGQEANNHEWVVVFAKSGHQNIEPKAKQKFVVMADGYRYQGVPGEQRFQAVKYQTYGQNFTSSVTSINDKDVDVLPSWKLLFHSWANANFAAELQWRISIPIAVFLLGLLAVPLSQANPRQGRFARLLPAVIIAIIYVNLMFLGRSWIEDKSIPAYFGMWWIHIILLALVLFLTARWTGWRFKRLA